MNKKALTFLSFLLIAVLNVSAQGINFQHISFEEALEKAKTENKLVFIDFYTSWCAPCKLMARDVFPLPEVGAVYNKQFVSLKLDAEREGAKVAAKYKVTSYPTFLYLKSDGTVALKDTGRMPTQDFIKNGDKAVASIDSEYSLENLKATFPNKQNDEHFLKMYIKKMQGYGQDITDGINAWLKVQTEMKEDSQEMMNFIMKNMRLFVLGSEGHRILNDNYNAYAKLATGHNARFLPFSYAQILKSTKKVALQKGDKVLLKEYIEAYKKQPEEDIKKDELVNAQLSYYAMTKDGENYKALTETYVDEVIKENPVSKVHTDDLKTYAMYKKGYDNDPIPARERMLASAKDGMKANKILKDLTSKGKAYLHRVNTKKEYKKLDSWVKYGYKLKPENCYMDDLMAKIYTKKDNLKKAVFYKERALKNWPKDDKKFVNKEYELEQLRKQAS
ncbi:thioredoxin family protein [Aestuariibaculum sp. YM273]|uniref:thioredoxin family protein n=1 Tax=Aestuariibaculum sp. YM273 TaxID=3070659 RepID=UPI0027DCC845|nr:thioredoxin family protein [Aestuariibaculum sp. YM273]WMI66017.1 thioredoxin family protein [Aestuariibaculum sp. YM273]